MEYSLESILTYARCPRKYKFQYIEGAPRSVSARRLYCEAHRKAIHDYFTRLKDGESPTAEDYYSVWDQEWTSKKSGVGHWRGRFESTAPIKAKKQATSFIATSDWPVPREIATVRKCDFGFEDQPDVSVNIDFRYDNSYGIISFFRCGPTKGKIVSDYTSNMVQMLKPERYISIIGVAHSGARYEARHITTKLSKRSTIRIVASILDQIAGIEAGHFPRCHPDSPRCSGNSCGFWRMCTKSPPGIKWRWNRGRIA